MKRKATYDDIVKNVVLLQKSIYSKRLVDINKRIIELLSAIEKAMKDLAIIKMDSDVLKLNAMVDDIMKIYENDDCVILNDYFLEKVYPFLEQEKDKWV